ncbi:hypothetical protein [Entomospira culicis]|uniref:Uncharacterized protein n=1 Tax=Entomospira culicis TaxID=2719989 RepID=A0A968GFH4_9SPIO|nr:hypothetical protein [Entomospira culicis]NIZ18651.1 hypothetical protein [Entomospira culicis]NIZ68866.1 hypothetical protein [Entomospira culicis]WDI37459.1 hypothetical protein PVA46_01340 [Entomospira culicis]WDI39087.1 hypothetical protein PVA47_01345 [Entomospira culicis]
MIDDMEGMWEYLDEESCYIEPKFSKESGIGSLALLTAYQGQSMFSYLLAPQTLGDLRKHAPQMELPLVLHSQLEVDVLDDLFNPRQNSALANRYIVRFGLGESELVYAKKMLGHKFKWFLLEVEHGAQQAVVEQVIAFRMVAPEAILMVGNFYNQESIDTFVMRLNERGAYRVDFWQVALDPHRLGVQNLGLASIAKIRQAGYPVVAKSRKLSAKLLFMALSAGARWVNSDMLSSAEGWQEMLHDDLKQLLLWQDVTNVDDLYAEVTLKSKVERRICPKS